MKPVYQTVFGSPGGNCMQAAVASIFELPLEQVPNFVENGDEWVEALVSFCAKYNLRPVFLSLEKREPGTNIGFSGGWWSVVTGKSPRGDYYHAVVAYNGSIVHDPHPDGEGKLISLLDECVFVQIDPARVTK